MWPLADLVGFVFHHHRPRHQVDGAAQAGQDQGARDVRRRGHKRAYCCFGHVGADVVSNTHTHTQSDPLETTQRGIIIPQAPFGMAKYDQGERFDLRMPYVVSQV